MDTPMISPVLSSPGLVKWPMFRVKFVSTRPALFSAMHLYFPPSLSGKEKKFHFIKGNIVLGQIDQKNTVHYYVR